MNLNPFVFSYKYYPNSKLATMVSKLCGGMQKAFFFLAIIIIATVVFDEIVNPGEALIASGIMLVLWLLLRLKKDVWSDKIAAKQEAVDNSDNIEEK